MLTSKELVYRALAFEDVPRVPYCVGFTIAAKDKFRASPDGPALALQIDNDIVSSSIVRMTYGSHDEQGRYTDEFGVTWDRSIDADIGVPAPIVTPETLDDFRFPDIDAPARYQDMVHAVKTQPDKFHLMTFNFSVYERAWSLRGLENLLFDFVEAPAFVETLLDRIVDWNIALIHKGLELCPEIDGVFFGDDFGTQLGVVMGAPRWRDIFKPRLARMYGTATAAGKKVFIHSCGKVQELFDDWVEIGVNCFNPFQPEVMSVHDIHAQYHGRLAFWGGISTQKTLPYGSVEQTEQEVDALLAMGRKGGYIIAPAHAMPGDINCDNVAAMLRKIINQPTT